MRAVKVIAWLNLIGNLVLVATGGVVRLTESGLGCTNAVIACTSSEFFAHDLHSFIEQGNRGLGVVLGLLAAAAVLLVWRLGDWGGRRVRPDLWAHALILLAGVVVEATVGALSVALHLASWVVGVHYLLSAILVGVATSFVIRAGRLPAAREHVVAPGMRILTHVTTFLLAVEVVFGVLTTQTGPHSGDETVIRDTQLWDPLVHIHSWVGYGLGVALLVLLISAIVHRERRFTVAVVSVIVAVAVQIAIGVAQARIALPPLLVGIHMVLAAITVALMVVLVDATKAPLVAATDAELEDQADDGVLNRSVN